MWVMIVASCHPPNSNIKSCVNTELGQPTKLPKNMKSQFSSFVSFG